MHGIGEEKARERVARRLLLGLDGGVALHLRLGHEGEEGEHELVELGHRGVREDHGLGGVKTAREVVDDHVVDVVADVLGGVAVSDDLVVRDDDVGAHAHVLQADAIDERAEVVPEVEAPRRAVAREHRVVLGMDEKVGVDLVALALCGLVASLVGHVFPLPRALARQRSHGLLWYGKTG